MFISLFSTIKIFLFTAVELMDAGVSLLFSYLLKYSKNLAVEGASYIFSTFKPYITIHDFCKFFGY